MFYCEPCRAKNEWPDSLGKSYGKCEVCDEVRSCYDRPSSTLPLPVRAKDDADEVLESILLRLQKRIDRL